VRRVLTDQVTDERHGFSSC